MQREGGCAVVRQGHLIAVVRAFLIGCAVILAVGCAGVRSQAPQKEEQAHTEATASEEARCEGTRTIKWEGEVVTTNDLPGCPKGGLLSGTNEKDTLYGGEGDDEIHGLGGVDAIFGGGGNDVIYGGPGDDSPLWGIEGDDVIYGGDGNDGGLGEQDLGEDVFYGGMATISFSQSATSSSRISSIAVKERTGTLLIRTTSWTAAARRRIRLSEFPSSLLEGA
jgi:hypothetical protein